MVSADKREDLFFGIGYAQAFDRLVQMSLVREIAYGRVSEKFAGTDELIEIDKFMRWLNLGGDLDNEIKKIEPDAKRQLEAYSQGINKILLQKRPLEFRMTGYKPAPWTCADSIITAKIMGYVGLAQTQGDMQKTLIQMIQNGMDEARIRTLFPTLTDVIDYDLIKSIKLKNKIIPDALWDVALPILKASNNWVISGDRTKSGSPILASDPHLEVNRLPAIWYEMAWKTNGKSVAGITMPGFPAIVMGRNDFFSWGGTYSFMDMIDYFIEDCRSGKFFRDGNWVPFTERTEILRPKKKKPITLNFYENHHGVLEGNPNKPGKYLAMNFSARTGAGADIVNVFSKIFEIQTVEEAQEKFRTIAAPTFNWVFADINGDIGYQMNGKMPCRTKNFSGLLPIPGWDSRNDWQGFVESSRLPTRYNPESGYLVTANNDLNKYGKVSPINLAMASYRADHINNLLAENKEIDASFCRKMHYDLYSKQAERLMKAIRPHLSSHHPKDKVLRDWNFVYSEDSQGAVLFETIYRNLIHIVFSQSGISERVMPFLSQETNLFSIYFGNFDDVLMDKHSPWFQTISRKSAIQKAVEKMRNTKITIYRVTRKMDMLNIIFGNQFPGFLGFDLKKQILLGSRATIPQGQFCRVGKRPSTIAPSFRMIVDLEKTGIQTNLPGGPSGSRFSKWYHSDLNNWKNGKYKTIK